MTRAWEKTVSPTGIEPKTFQTPSGCFGGHGFDSRDLDFLSHAHAGHVDHLISINPQDGFYGKLLVPSVSNSWSSWTSGFNGKQRQSGTRGELLTLAHCPVQQAANIINWHF